MGLTERELCSETPRPGDSFSPPDSRLWFALTVKPQHEMTVQQGLSAKGLNAYAPLYWTARRWSDRVKKLRVPLFPGYVFCCFDANDPTPVLRTPGVRTVVSFGHDFAPIPGGQLASIQQMLDSALPVEPCPYLCVGRKVRISEGPLVGIEGIVVRHANATRVVVSVDLLQRSIAVSVDPGCLLPLN